MYKYKDKTFLYYFEKNSIVWKVPAVVKIVIYLILNIFVLVNTFYILNIIISLFIFIILFLIGFVKYKKNIFKLLGVSLFLFFFISLILQIIQSDIVLANIDIIFKTILYILTFFSKWLLINLSGLLMFCMLSQEELISFLLKIKFNFRIMISITIAFNLITRLIDTLEEINISLNSRGIVGKGIETLFNKIRYVFIAMLIDNIEYISLLRATYAFDYIEIKKKYEK